MLPPFDLPEEIFLLVTDEKPSPADFILHQALISQLKASLQCIVLSVSESQARWKAIVSKNSTTVSPQNPHFIDLFERLENSDSGLQAIIDEISQLIQASKATLVILDDITMLEWTGMATILELTRFIRALRLLCAKQKATLLVRHHITNFEEPDELFRTLQQLCSYHLDVRPLISGKSGSVSGEVALHQGPSTRSSKGVKLMTRSKAIQYRLSDFSAVYFARGNSSSIL